MDARQLTAAEKVPASRKLGRDDALAMLQESNRLVVAKGKKVNEWKIGSKVEPQAVDAMLGPTGNLRAPTIQKGKTFFVGFNEEAYTAHF